jgi:hypothetical protein
MLAQFAWRDLRQQQSEQLKHSGVKREIKPIPKGLGD